MNFKEMTIYEIAEEIHRNAVDKGFWDNPVDFETQIALFHSEVSEAFEAYRKTNQHFYYLDNGKPEGWATELIDVMIRILDYLQGSEYIDIFGFNDEYICRTDKIPVLALELHLELSNAYNMKNHEYIYRVFMITKLFLEKSCLDWLNIMQLKHEYNLTRPKLHGKRF